jgi:hypothetical protein
VAQVHSGIEMGAFAKTHLLATVEAIKLIRSLTTEKNNRPHQWPVSLLAPRRLTNPDRLVSDQVGAFGSSPPRICFTVLQWKRIRLVSSPALDILTPVRVVCQVPPEEVGSGSGRLCRAAAEGHVDLSQRAAPFAPVTRGAGGY